MSEIRFFNTLGRSFEPFEPLKQGQVRIYTCGPTVYNHAHIGNLRTFLFEDFLVRSLDYLGLSVLHVMNLTDVDDKTIRRAQEESLSLRDLTNRYIESFLEDLDTLHVRRASEYPRATDHIPEMIEMVQQLESQGIAYRGEDGSVFFRISKDEDYGRLSGIDPSQTQRGERVASDEYDKEDARDFVLWKAAKDGEPSWDSPWGPGRPGWHIECSAMSMKFLGPTFDIHCGGVDNIFPHHENEIAQSESATGQTFATTWLHSEHLMVDSQKMSKSLGNQYTLKDLIDRGADPRALRYLFLATHYRQKLNFTFDSLEASGKALRRIDEMRFRLQHAEEAETSAQQVAELANTLEEEFAAALADDLNASEALGAVFRFVRGVNRLIESDDLGQGDKERVTSALASVDRVLGFLDPADWSVEEESAGLSDDEVDRLLEARQEARKRRDFAEADRLRDELTSQGILIEDTPQGPRWRRS